MKKYNIQRYSIPGWLMIISAILILSCNPKEEKLSIQKASLVKDSVVLLASRIEKDITANGPIAWLNYFEDVPGFFMASEGRLAFKDYQSAKTFIKDTLVTALPKIELRWSNLRVDPLTDHLASIGTDFHETITDASGKTILLDGYFTAVAEETKLGWKLRNVHWSVLNGN